MHTHDPREHIRGFHQILISDKKRIGFLFGAGTSYATGLASCSMPTIDNMTRIVVDAVAAESTLFGSAIHGMKTEAQREGAHFNVESLLSSIEAKRAVIGDGQLNGLDAAGFKKLSGAVKNQVVKLVSVHDGLSPNDRKKLAHARLSNWIQKARRRFPSEIFTTNYDFLFEIALEGSGIPYFDGFSGGFEPFFCPEAVEDLDAYPGLVKLWKMHGSIGWSYRDLDKAVVRQAKTSEDSILIYPSHLKYSDSKKQPYVGLIDRLCAFLQQDDAVLITCGYSFGDDHINERIVTSLRRGASSHVIALLYDQGEGENGASVFSLEDPSNRVRVMATSETGGKMSVYGRRHAVIGGKFGAWQLKDEPKSSDAVMVSEYFDEDAAKPISGSGESKGDEVWNGTGLFLLPDFRRLTGFLDELSSSTKPPSSGL